MRKIKWHFDTGFAGCIHEGEFEVEDDATEEEIGEMVLGDVANYVNWTWWEEKDGRDG